MQRHATQSVVIGELYRTPALKLFVRAEPGLGPSFEKLLKVRYVASQPLYRLCMFRHCGCL